MKTVRNAMLLLWGVLICYPIGMKAQDKFDASVGMDLVSGYIWRGQDLGNVSIQPEVSLAYKGFSLTGWGTVGFDKDDIKEFDLTLGYEVKGFSCSVTDYWTNGGPGYFHYGAHNTSHTFEAQIGYDFGFLSVDWFTNFAGNIGYKADGSKAYASYFSVSVPFVLGGLDWTVEAGATPWENDLDGKILNTHRHLMIGVAGELKEYFNTKSWYSPQYDADSFDENMEQILNQYELKNADVIKTRENEVQ